MKLKYFFIFLTILFLVSFLYFGFIFFNKTKGYEKEREYEKKRESSSLKKRQIEEEKNDLESPPPDILPEDFANVTQLDDSEKISSQLSKEKSQRLELSEGDLFEKAFGVKMPKGYLALVKAKLIIGGSLFGELDAQVGIGDLNIKISAEQFLKETKKIIRSSIQKDLEGRIPENGFFSIRDLRKGGLDVRFDRQRFYLIVNLKANQYNPEQTILSNNRNVPPWANKAVPNSTFSAFVNSRVRQTFTHYKPGGVDETRGPLGVYFDGAVNFKSWVIEGRGDYRESDRQSWRRGPFRLVKDFINPMLRFSGGDVFTSTSGFGSAVRLGGVALEKNFTIDPYRIVRPVSEFKFFLESKSTVEIFINDILIKTLYLNPGEHDLLNFPVLIGGNDIKLKITDDTGAVETLEFPFIKENSLLKEGLHQYSASIGFPPSSNSNGGYKYNKKKLTFSFYDKFGFTKTLSLIAYLQKDNHNLIFGGGGVFATHIGLFSFDGALSRNPFNKFSYAGKLNFQRYIKKKPKGKSGISFYTGASYKGKDFAYLGQEKTEKLEDNESIYFYLGLGHSLFNYVRASHNFNYKWDRVSGRSYGITTSLGTSIGNNIGISGSLGYRKYDSASNQEFFAVLSLSWRGSIPKWPNHLFSITQTIGHNTGKPTTNASWDYSPSGGLKKGLRFGAGTSFDKENCSLNGNLGYKHQLFSINLSNATTSGYKFDKDEIGSRTSITLASAVAFAGGKFAISNGIGNGGFAIVDPIKNLADTKIFITSMEGSEYFDLESYSGVANVFGPGVEPSLSAYRYKKIFLVPYNLPIGADPGDLSYVVYPTYKSGVLIQPGSDATVALDATLIGPDGSPFGLKVGEIIMENGKKIVFFTNKKGRMRQMGLTIGKIKIQMFEGDLKPYEVIIPEDVSGIYKIGEIKLTKKETAPTEEAQKEKENIDETK